MRTKRADNFVNYQERALQFSPGDIVVPYGMFDIQAGRVTAVYPGIGMVDVEMSTGNKRYPAESLQRVDENGNSQPPFTNSTPGGDPTVVVTASVPSAAKVALYWAAKDRQYKMNKSEQEHGACCPKCGPEQILSPAIYKRRDGSSERLLGCKGCLFLIKDSDIINHTNYGG